MATKTYAERKLAAAEKETALNTNRDGVLVTPGQIWQDCNPRAKGRTLSITSIKAGSVEAFDGNRVTKLNVAKMHEHSRGYKPWNPLPAKIRKKKK